MFAHGVAKAGRKYHMGVIIVNKWAPAKGMDIRVLYMHMYEVSARSKLRRWPFEVILLVSVTDTNHSTFQGKNNSSGRLKV